MAQLNAEKMDPIVDPMEIEELLRSLGIGKRYHGFRFVKVAIALVMEDEEYIWNMTKMLYPEVAARCSTQRKINWSCVERDIRTVIGVCWENGRRRYEEIAGHPVESKPSPVDFIDTLADYLRRKNMD